MSDSKRKNFGKSIQICCMVGFILIFLYISLAEAQVWPFGNGDWYNIPYFSSYLSLYPSYTNTIPSYRGSLGNTFYPTSGNFFQLFSPQPLFLGTQYGIGGFNYPNTISTDILIPPSQNILYFGKMPSAMFPTSYPLGNFPGSPSNSITAGFNTGWGIISYPLPESKRTPMNLRPVTGKWQSNVSSESGKLYYDYKKEILRMEGSSLLEEEGTMTEYNYTPKFGKSPISFKAEFDSGYAAEISGIVDNNWDGNPESYNEYFYGEGDYVIKDSTGQIIDSGTFTFGSHQQKT